MSFLCLVSMFKNESHILEEWIQHYIRQGVDHFFLIDNGSSDDYMKSLEKHISSGIVTLNVNPQRYNHAGHLNYYLDHIKNYDWTLVCDLDEFMYARKDFSKISDYVRSLSENVNQMHVPWKLFGSNGHIKQPDSVVPNFLKRQHCPNVFQSKCKCINRTKNIKRLELHCCNLIENMGFFTSDGKTLDHGGRGFEFSPVSETILDESQLHLNHYPIQSWEWFRDIKMTRGDPITPSGDNYRNEWYFNAYDHSGVLDEELKNLNSI